MIPIHPVPLAIAVSSLRICVFTIFLMKFIDLTRWYRPLRRLISSSCEGLRPGLFLPFRPKKIVLVLDVFFLFFFCCAYFRHFWCSVLTLVTFRTNLWKTEGEKKSEKSPNKTTKKNCNNHSSEQIYKKYFFSLKITFFFLEKCFVLNCTKKCDSLSFVNWGD